MRQSCRHENEKMRLHEASSLPDGPWDDVCFEASICMGACASSAALWWFQTCPLREGHVTFWAESNADLFVIL